MKNTKQNRLAERKVWIGDKITEVYKDIEILKTERLHTMTGNMHYNLQIWKGTAGKPYINYYFKSLDTRQKYIDQEKVRADRRAERKEEEKSKPKQLSQSAQAAASIRKILKREYPEIKFKVRCDNYSMGSSVDVSWTDGVATEIIQKFIDQYQYGHFNGMEDIYEISNRKDMPQAKYCMAKRTISDKVYEDAFQFAKKYYANIDDTMTLNSWYEPYNTTIRNMLWRKLNKMDLRKGFDAEQFKELIHASA